MDNPLQLGQTPLNLPTAAVTIAVTVLVLSLFALFLIRQQRRTNATAARFKTTQKKRQLLDSATLSIAGRLDLKETLLHVCTEAQNLSQADRSAVHLVERGENFVRMAAAHGFSEDYMRLNRTYSTDLEKRTTCISNGAPMLISDLHKLSLPTFFTDSLLAENIGGFADFPLLNDEGVFGYLSVYFDQPTDLDPEMVDFMVIFSKHTSAAIQNAKRYARTETVLLRRAHQLEILENVGRELAAASHSGALFELVLDQALEFTNSPWGGLYLYDPHSETIQIRAGRGLATTESTKDRESDPRQEAVQFGEPVILDGRNPTTTEFFLSSGARSHMSVPLIHKGQAVGVLSLESPDELAFTKNDQLFIGQIATQAAVALVNARLYEESQQRLTAQTALYQASRRLVGNIELEKIVLNVIQSFHETIQSQASGAYLWDDIQQAYRLTAVSGEHTEAVDHLPKVVHERTWEESSSTRLGTGLLQLPAESDLAGSPLTPFPGCKTLALPLSRGEQLLGLILSYIPETLSLKDEDLQLPRAIAAQGAIAVQNALLFQDVTEGRDRLEAVLNSVDEGVLMIDEEESVILANEVLQSMTGISLEEVLGQPFSQLPQPVLDLIGIESAEGESVFRALMQPDRLHPPRVILPGDGEKGDRVYERFASPVWGQGQEGIGWVFVLRDVTEEHQLNQARELLTETLVHDLRSPIGAVGSALSILEEVLPKDLDDPAVGQSLDIARRSTSRVVGLVESMMDLSRMEAGLIDLQNISFDLADLATELILDYTPQANQLGIILLSEIAADQSWVVADKDKITRVLVNLVDNALKFTPEGGQISLQSLSHPDKSHIEVAVLDNGPGVPEEYRKKIFDRFSQVPGARARRRGSGLGLTFCRLVIEAHGGEIWVEGQPDVGSRFVFTLNKDTEK